MQFLLFQLQKLFIFLTDLAVYPVRKFRSLWEDSTSSWQSFPIKQNVDYHDQNDLKQAIEHQKNAVIIADEMLTWHKKRHRKYLNNYTQAYKPPSE